MIIRLYFNLFLICLLFAATSVSAQSHRILSPNGRYEAIIIKINKSHHFQVKDFNSGRILFTTHAQYKTKNDVKAGYFSSNSKFFLAAYHYGHSFRYTWIGVWNTDSGRLTCVSKQQGWNKNIAWVVTSGHILCSGPGQVPDSKLDIYSPNTKYYAKKILDYIISDVKTNKIILKTHSRFRNNNPVKSGAFSSDSKEFAAAYHYGHKGKYTWIGIWDISSGRLRNNFEKKGWITSLSGVFNKVSAENNKKVIEYFHKFKVIGPLKGGIMYYYDRIKAPGYLQKITNPKIDALGKNWTVSIPKPGYSTNDCWDSRKVIKVNPGASTDWHKGANLYNGKDIGFCLTPNDQWTQKAGWPSYWALKITYKN